MNLVQDAGNVIPVFDCGLVSVLSPPGYSIIGTPPVVTVLPPITDEGPNFLNVGTGIAVTFSHVPAPAPPDAI